MPKASAQTKTDEHLSCREGMAELPEMHMLYTCPFCWKVRGLVEHIGLDTELIQVNPLKQKKQLAFAGGWKKTPVWRDALISIQPGSRSKAGGRAATGPEVMRRDSEPDMRPAQGLHDGLSLTVRMNARIQK